MISIYFQLILLLNLEEISRLVRISMDVNLLAIDFPFKPRRILKIRKGFNLYQSTFNSFSF